VVADQLLPLGRSARGEQTTTVSWREVEVELGEHGQHKLLDRIERRLLKGRRPACRVLLEAGPAAGRPDASACRPAPFCSVSWEVVLAYLGTQAKLPYAAQHPGRGLPDAGCHPPDAQCAAGIRWDHRLT
jgi:hypothetical protein